MKQLALTLMITLAATAAQAECYADYKAKQDDPLRLHYGVAQILGDCSASNASLELAPRLAAQGWTLLNVVAVFDATGLPERKASAGPYFLRF